MAKKFLQNSDRKKEENRHVVAFGLFVALVSLVFSSAIADCFNLPKFIVALGGIIGFSCWLMTKFFNMKVVTVYKNPLYLPLLAFIVWEIVCLFFAANKIYRIAEIGLNVVCAVLIFIVPFILRKSSDVILFFRIVVISSMFVAIYGILQHYGLDPINWQIKKSALSTLGRRNFAGEYLVLVLPWALFCFLTSEKKLRLLFGSIFILLLFHLFLTFTRASWIGFVISMMTLIFLKLKFKIPKAVKLVSVLIFFIMVLNAYADVFQFEQGTVKSRIDIWKICISLIKSRPLAGWGTGNFEIAYYEFAENNPGNVLVPVNQRVSKAHNEFIEIAVENGIIGLLLFLFFIFTIYKMAWDTVANKKEQPVEKFISISAISSITGILVNSIASFPLQTTMGSFFFFLNCGILSRMYFVVNNPEKHEIKFSFSGIPFVCMIVACAYIVFTFTAISSSYSLKKSKDIMRIVAEIHDPILWIQAEIYGRNVVSYNPFNIEGYYHLGKVYLAANEIEKARENFLRALKFQPHSEVILLNLGIVEQRSKNFQLAEKYFIRALKISEKNPEILKALWNFYSETGNTEKANQYLEKILKINPDFVPDKTGLSN
ncbi:MAG: O-antigen ligase family protein [Candidatus Omnitrophica bacterium]|nr:O-antigen ligase family protein [Candidatus Omnitrophota bacterium]